MKRVVIISTLLNLVITLLFLPNYPALHYYIEKITISNADNITIESTNSLIGDFKYIAAISKRASDIKNDTESENTPPKTNKNISNIVYLLFENNTQIDVPGRDVNYFNTSQKIHIRYIPVNTPPPIS